MAMNTVISTGTQSEFQLKNIILVSTESDIQTDMAYIYISHLEVSKQSHYFINKTAVCYGILTDLSHSLSTPKQLTAKTPM